MSTTPSQKSAFVVMPVSGTATCSEQEWSDIFTEVFTPAFRDCGYACKRATPCTGNLIRSIITELRGAWIVLADLTDRNANVFYELGVRHSLSKRTILVAQNSDHIPSDLRGYWWLVYGTKPGEVSAFRKEIAELVKHIEAHPDRSDSPVSDFIEQEMLGVSGYLTREAVKKLSALFTELTGTINTLGQLESDPRYAKFLSCSCLELLLSTLYIDVGAPLLSECYELRHALQLIEAGLRLDPDFIGHVQTLAKEVLGQIHEIRMRLARGEFIEPTEVSVMVWSPEKRTLPAAGEDQGTKWLYSCSKDLSKIDLNDLRRHFLGPKE